jgi:hypothetical protein
MIGMLILMRRRLAGLDGWHIWQSVIQAGLGAAVMGAALWGWLTVSAGRSPLVVVVGGLTGGALIYALLLVLQRTPEVEELWDAVRRRVFK